MFTQLTNPLKVSIAVALIALSATLAMPRTLFAGNASVSAPGISSHLYVFNSDGQSLATYSTVDGPIIAVDVQNLSVYPHPTLKDKNGAACQAIDVTAMPGMTAHLTWSNAFGDEPFDLVVSDEKFVLCNEQLPNHDQLPYPPD